jgi:ribonuclease J
LSGPDVVSRGFVYVRESEELMEEVRQLAYEIIDQFLSRPRQVDRMEIKNNLRDEISKYLYARTKRKPMVLPILMNM